MAGIDKNTLFLLHGDSYEDASFNKLTVSNDGTTISSRTHFSGGGQYLFQRLN